MAQVDGVQRTLPAGHPIGVAFGIALVPFALTVLAFTVAATAGAADDIGAIGSFAIYNAGNVVGLVVAVAVLGRERLRSLAPIERPSAREVAAAVAAFFVGLGVYGVVEAAIDALGLSFGGSEYALADPVSIAVVVLGAVVIAPVVEEVLFRGILLGTMLERGWHPAVAAVACIAPFAAIHVPMFGAVGGVAFIAAWTTLPTALRLAFDDLSGAMLMHALNNAFAYVIVVAFLS